MSAILGTQATRRYGPGDDKLMIEIGEDQWPLWPVPPVVKRGTNEDGVIFSGRLTTVYLTNLFCLGPAFDFNACPKREYQTVDDLLADGWRVD
jgi:hypothetical protein